MEGPRAPPGGLPGASFVILGNAFAHDDAAFVAGGGVEPGAGGDRVADRLADVDVLGAEVVRAMYNGGLYGNVDARVVPAWGYMGGGAVPVQR